MVSKADFCNARVSEQRASSQMLRGLQAVFMRHLVSSRAAQCFSILSRRANVRYTSIRICRGRLSSIRCQKQSRVGPRLLLGRHVLFSAQVAHNNLGNKGPDSGEEGLVYRIRRPPASKHNAATGLDYLSWQVGLCWKDALPALACLSSCLF